MVKMTAEHNFFDISFAVDKPSEWKITTDKLEKHCHKNKLEFGILQVLCDMMIAALGTFQSAIKLHLLPTGHKSLSVVQWDIFRPYI